MKERIINFVLDVALAFAIYFAVSNNTAIVISNEQQNEVYAASSISYNIEEYTVEETTVEETMVAETVEEMTKEEFEEELATEETTEEEIEEETTEEFLKLRKEVVKTALSYLGTPYVFGGEDPETGIDCSKFMQLVCAKYEVALPRNSKKQYDAIEHISREELLPGDLVFYGSQRTGRDYIGHVAMYIGDGKIIHARAPEYGVCITDVIFNEYDILGCGRVF